jgi:hypothetical protein
MNAFRRCLVAAVVSTAPLASAAPASAAGVALPFPAGGAGNSAALGACARSTAPQGQGSVGQTTIQSCGLNFIGPSTGQIAAVIGPTIISPGFAGTVVVSAGNGAAFP